MIQSPSIAATVSSLSPAHLHARYQGLTSLSWQAGLALAPILGGLVLEKVGDATLWVSCFVIGALVAGGQLLAGPARRRRMPPPVTVVADDLPHSEPATTPA